MGSRAGGLKRERQRARERAGGRRGELGAEQRGAGLVDPEKSAPPAYRRKTRSTNLTK